MPAPILPISPAALPDRIRTAASAGAASGSGFQDVFAKAIGSVEGAAHAADAAVERFLSGEGEELHTTAMAVQRAELSFDLFLQARNKVAQAYQEIMRMQL